jgi:hypothetical protein
MKTNSVPAFGTTLLAGSGWRWAQGFHAKEGSAATALYLDLILEKTFAVVRIMAPGSYFTDAFQGRARPDQSAPAAAGDPNAVIAERLILSCRLFRSNLVGRLGSVRPPHIGNHAR